MVEEAAGFLNPLFRRRRRCSLQGAVMRSAHVKVSLAGVRVCRTVDLQRFFLWRHDHDLCDIDETFMM